MQKALEKKQRAEEKKQAQLDAKQASKDKITAARILAKVAPTISLLESACKSPLFSKLPSYAKTSAEKHLDDMKAMRKNAQNCIEKQVTLEYTLSEVLDATKTATNCSSSLQQMCVAASAISGNGGK